MSDHSSFQIAKPLKHSLATLALILIFSPCCVAASEMTSGEMTNASSPDPLDRPIKAGTPSAIPLRSREVKPDLFLITGRGANAVVRRTPAGLILIDNKVQYNLVWRELQATLNKISDLPVRYAFMTHHHADHSGLNQKVIDAGVDLIGHKNLLEIFKTYKSVIAPINPAPPTITFDDTYEVELGGVKAIAYYWGASHTDADIAVYFPDIKAIAVGDLLYHNGEPAVDGHYGRGSIFGMLQRLDDLLAIEFDIALPGHGDNVVTRDEVLLYRQRLAEVIRRGQEAIENGATPEQLVEAIDSADLGLRLIGHFWESPKSLYPIYEELKAANAR